MDIQWHSWTSMNFPLLPLPSFFSPFHPSCLLLFSLSKLTGMAFRVPVPDVSVVDLTVRIKEGVSLCGGGG